MARKQTFSIQNQNSDSSGIGQSEFLAIGKLRRPHGVRGEILMSVWTDFPERLEPGVIVYLGEDQRPVQIRGIRGHGEGLLIAFEDYPHREAVGALRNKVVMVRADDRPPLDDGEFYIHQLIGMAVVEDSTDRFLGTLNSIIETGANDVYIVRQDSGADLLLPAIESVILHIDPNLREIRVYLIPGLEPKK